MQACEPLIPLPHEMPDNYECTISEPYSNNGNIPRNCKEFLNIEIVDTSQIIWDKHSYGNTQNRT